MRRLLLWSNVVVLLPLLGAYLAPYVAPASAWWLALCGLLYPYLLFLQIVFILLWAMLRPRYILLPLLGILIGWNALTRLIGWHSNLETGEGFTVMTYNARHLRGGQAQAPVQDFVEWLSDTPVDIVCFQEFPAGGPLADRLIAQIKERTDLHHLHRQPGHSLATFATRPITAVDHYDFGNSSNGYHVTDIQIGQHPLRIYNLHLQTNALSGVAERVAREGLQDREQAWYEIDWMLRRYTRATRVRAKEADMLAQKITDSPHPVLVVGDFNDVPQSYVYRKLRGPRQDAFSERGSGLGTTYRGSLPGLRIDYVLPDQALDVTQHRRSSVGFSDHRPVIVRMNWKSPATK